MEIAAIIVLLILSALFSGSEIAFVAANRLKVEVFARGSRVVGPIARDFINDPAKLLTTTLVGNNLALVAYSTLMAILLEPSLHAAFTSLGAGRTAVEIATLFSQTMIASIIVLFFGEILPKSILREIPTRSVFALAIPLRTTYYLLLPLIKLAAFASNGLIRLFNIDAETFSQFMRRDFGAVYILDAVSGPTALLTPHQILVAMVTITLFMPCFATLLMVAREHGTKVAASISAFIFPFAFLVGGLVNHIGKWLQNM